MKLLGFIIVMVIVLIILISLPYVWRIDTRHRVIATKNIGGCPRFANVLILDAIPFKAFKRGTQVIDNGNILATVIASTIINDLMVAIFIDRAIPISKMVTLRRFRF